ADERGKPRYASVRQFLIAVSDDASYGWRVAAKSVGEARADREPHPRVRFNHQRADAPLVSSFALYVIDHSRFGVDERLDFQQCHGAPRLVTGTRAAQHQAFASERFDAL